MLTKRNRVFGFKKSLAIMYLILTALLLGVLAPGSVMAINELVQPDLLPLLSAPPNPPTLLVAIAISPTQVTLYWKDNSNNEDGWIIEWREEGTPQWQSTKSQNPNIPNWGTSAGMFKPGTEYSFRVFAYNIAGKSVYSSEVSRVTTPPDPRTRHAPQAPSKLVAKAISTNEVELTWQDNSNNEVQFSICRRKAGSRDWEAFRWVVNANVTTYTDRNAYPNTTYIYAVVAGYKYKDVLGWSWLDSGPSNEVTVTTPTTKSPPEPPTPITPIQSQTIQNLTARFRWGYPAATLSCELQVAGDAFFNKIVLNKPGITVSGYDMPAGLQWNKTYFWRVRATNASGTSPWSPIQVFKTK